MQNRVKFEALDPTDESLKVKDGSFRGKGIFVAKFKIPKDKVKQFQFPIAINITPDKDKDHEWHFCWGATKDMKNTPTQNCVSLSYCKMRFQQTSNLIYHFDFEKRSIKAFSRHSKKMVSEQTISLQQYQEYCYIGLNYTSMPEKAIVHTKY